MDIPPEIVYWVNTYGYLAVFLGSLVEGEILVVAASFLSYLDQMHLPIIMLMAFSGTWISDVGWFMAGRYSGTKFLEKWQWLNGLSGQSIRLVGKRPKFMAFSMRFMYGLRIVIPFSLGKTQMPASTFMVYNALGVMLWTAIFTSIGYFFASLTETIFGRIHHWEIVVPLFVLGIMVLFIYISHLFEYLLKLYPKK